uniref:Protein kinase domain-containing protein n=1 Tax=Populus alba TaxID=43335 RepID=A0A4U5R4M7_POPAL|nr:hypothetical protein D5086_0000003990 [Populus alba]
MDSSIQAILAAAASFFLITLIFAIIVIVCKSTSNQDCRRRRRQRHHHQTRTVPNPELSITIDESATFDPAMNRISMEELKVSTKNFSADLIIGDGSFGLVYKATLFNGSTVAIKKLDPDAFQGFREFRAEMETLGKLRHRNMVKILGYCVSGLERVLILEFVERGSLDQWIHDTSSTNNEQKMLGQNRHMEMLDSNTPKEGLSEDEVKEYFRIASLCTGECIDRPAMSEVVGLLKNLST